MSNELQIVYKYACHGCLDILKGLGIAPSNEVIEDFEKIINNKNVTISFMHDFINKCEKLII